MGQALDHSTNICVFSESRAQGPMARLRVMPAVAAYEGLKANWGIVRPLDIYGGSSSGPGESNKGTSAVTKPSPDRTKVTLLGTFGP